MFQFSQEVVFLKSWLNEFIFLVSSVSSGKLHIQELNKAAF